MENSNTLNARIKAVLPMLDEHQRRIYLAAEAKSIGWGGVSKIAKLAGVSRLTVAKEINTSKDKISKEYTSKAGIRKAGGGRKATITIQPKLLQSIESIVSPHTMGDPMNPLIWTSKSIRKIQQSLHDLGYTISHELVRQCLLTLKYSLQANKKTKEGGKHPDRNLQFEHINEKAKEFISCKDPVISVDCKKKELIGDYKNNGQEWTPAKHPTEVNVYDFIDKNKGKANPYGVYDVAQNTGWVNVGVSADTASFAVSTINDWWKEEGIKLYPNSKRLYINSDGGGSNGSRNHLWKAELQKFSNENNLEIHVSHFPPGTSKWNKIEHRLFAFISKNWRAKPLISLAITVNLISSTTTQTGLKVKAKLDTKIYLTKQKVSESEKRKLNIKRNEFHGEWNYVISPNL